MESSQQTDSKDSNEKQYIILDTCILQYLGNKHVGMEVKCLNTKKKQKKLSLHSVITTQLKYDRVSNGKTYLKISLSHLNLYSLDIHSLIPS